MKKLVNIEKKYNLEVRYFDTEERFGYYYNNNSNFYPNWSFIGYTEDDVYDYFNDYFNC